MDGGLIIVLGFMLLLLCCIISLCISDTMKAKYSKELVQTRADLAKLKMLNKLKMDWDEKPIVWEEMK